jgi:hypothetical protein
MIAAFPVSIPVNYFAESGPMTLPVVIEFESYSCYFN